MSGRFLGVGVRPGRSAGYVSDAEYDEAMLLDDCNMWLSETGRGLARERRADGRTGRRSGVRRGGTWLVRRAVLRSVRRLPEREPRRVGGHMDIDIGQPDPAGRRAARIQLAFSPFRQGGAIEGVCGAKLLLGALFAGPVSSLGCTPLKYIHC